jgi:L-lactate dehydrogenase complex protein LldG
MFRVNENITKNMKAKAAAASTVVHEITSMDEAARYAVSLCQNKGMKSIAGIALEANDHKLLLDLCTKEGISFIDGSMRDHVSDIDVSITFADAGIADTGTLMVRSNSEDIRIATMMAKIHVAVLPASHIKKDTAEIEKELDTILKSDSPSYTAFITGPSRTADIERVLAIGVHGPTELHLLILKENQV